MKKGITSRLEILLAKIAGHDVSLSTMTPPVAANATEELLLEIADRMDNAASELPSVTKTDEGKILSVNNKGKWVAADETKELPTVSGTDNGNVLTVVEGAWAKAAAPSGGGGVLMVTVTQESTNWTFNKTWQEVYDAFTAGTNVILSLPVYDTSGAGYFDYELVTGVIYKDASYQVVIMTGAGEYAFRTSSANGYPYENFD